MEWSYVAGFFDGEGCVTCGLSTRANKTKTRRRWYPIVRCAMVNIDKSVLEAIQTNFSMGTIHTLIPNYNRPEGREAIMLNKAAYSLIICKQPDIIRFVDGVYPHSIVKKKQLALIRDAVLFIQKNNRKKWSKSKIIKYNRIFIKENAKLNNTTRGRKRTLERVFS